MNLIISLLHPI